MAYYTLSSYKLNFKPFEIFEALKEEKNCFFFDSSQDPADYLGRYSFLGFGPFYILKGKDQVPFDKLRELTEKYKITGNKSEIPFLGGAVGYLSYDLGFLLEDKLKKKLADDLAIPDFFFGFYSTVIITDNIKKKLHIFSTGSRALCKDNFNKINKLLSKAADKRKIKRDTRASGCKEFKSNFSKESYIRAVKKAKEYIKNGDIYQVNLSQRFQAKTGRSGFKIYQKLRKLNPSSFGAYFDAGDFQILSSSPERFLSLSGDKVTTRPMKGTRPRGIDKCQDANLKSELLNSPKDKAELTMIVDLERNDLGKVCNYDSIKVNALRELEKYNTVYQTTATIEGRLYKDKDKVDLLRACFPGGSITGCPKIRSMEIIEELELNRRSIYTGSLGYLSFSGNMDFNILIRTILKKNDELFFGVGGGIVADSDPEAEYEETLVKAKAMVEAIQ